MKTLYTFALSFLLTTPLLWAQVAAPAAAQTQPIALVGATAHIGNGQVVENALIVLQAGKILEVREATGSDEAIDGHKMINATGMHAYPGLIIPSTDLGLAEVSAVRATIDRAEQGQLNPNVRSIIAYNTDSEMIPTLRFNGILTAQVTPTGGMISGSSSVVQLDAWNWEDAAIRTDDGLHLNWPRKMLPPRWWLGETAPRKNDNYEKNLQELTKLMQDAKAYAANPPEKANLKLAAMQGLFDGSQTLFIRVNLSAGILQSLQLAQRLGVKKMVIVGGIEALAVKEYLKEHNIPVIVGLVHRLPGRTHRDVFQPYKLPYLLHQAGIKVALAYLGRSASSRNLPFLAGTAVAYGLDKETALQMVTANTADILGVGDQLGTLEKGKDATLVISSGDLLDMRGNNLQHAFIQGREVSINNKQQVLYQKYKDKYENSGE